MSWNLDDAISSLADEICLNCREYKGLVTCDVCGGHYCIFCEDGPCCDPAEAAAEDEQAHWENDPEYAALYFPPD